MARMIDLIRQSAVPSNVMRSASKGALTLPAGEILEILVYLTTNPVFAKDAAMTLAGWDEKSCAQVLADPQTPFEVTNYFLDPKNRRPKLVPALLENPAVRESALMELAQTQSREIVEMMLKSARVRRSTDILHALGTNPQITDQEKQEIEMALRNVGLDTVQIHAVLEPVEEVPAEEEGPSQYEIDNAAAIAAEEAAAKPFTVLGPIDESAMEPEAAAEPISAAEAQATIAAAVPESELAAVPASEASAAAPALAMDPNSPDAIEHAKAMLMREAEKKTTERISVLQKIARLTVGQRVQLAMKGNKEERSILIRDGSKLVSSAVLVSPKVTDAEIETFAGMKNVQEQVLRDIARAPKFKKNYLVMKALANNPRTPMDISLTLMGNLMVNDLKNLSMNKNVPDTVRKLAMKRFKEKSSPGK
ncbi:MAG: hypothetical protein ACJ71N_12870 [Terriglobales bacterium]|jgi:hypothetical protein